MGRRELLEQGIGFGCKGCGISVMCDDPHNQPHLCSACKSKRLLSRRLTDAENDRRNLEVQRAVEAVEHDVCACGFNADQCEHKREVGGCHAYD